MILALGVAAATVTFAVLDAVILRPLPYIESQSIVRLQLRSPSDTKGLSRDEILALRSHARGLTSIGIVQFNTMTDLRMGEVADRGDIALATLGYVEALKLMPMLGRLWSVEEEVSGGAGVVLLGHDFWRRALKADLGVLGRSLRIGSKDYRVIGVMPPDAVRIDGSPIAAWLPNRDLARSATSDDPRLFYPVGRLRGGESLTELEAEAGAIIGPLAGGPGSSGKEWKVDVLPIDAELLGPSERWLIPAAIAVGLLLLITCVNAGSIALSRSIGRAGELALRSALGASTRRLVGVALGEGLCLALVAGAIAAALAWWGIGVIKPVLPPMFRSSAILFDGRVFLACGLTAIASGLFCAVWPILQASRAHPSFVARDSQMTASVGTRWQQVFLVCEIACVTCILIVSALFVISFVRAFSKDLGFNQSMLLTVSTLSNYDGTVSDVSRRFLGVPGITGVAAVAGGSPPLVGAAFGGAFPQIALQRLDGSPATEVTTDVYAVSSNFFEVAGIAFSRGQTWRADSAGGVIVIDAGTAERLFGDSNPIGERVLAPRLRDKVVTVIGVIPRQYSRGPESERGSAYYVLGRETQPRVLGLILRTSQSPWSLVPVVEQVAASIAPPNPSPGAGVRVVDDALRRLTERRRFTAQLMLTFGVVASMIGVGGMFAVIQSTVSRRIREFAIRLAVGGSPTAVLASVLVGSLKLVALGLALGVLTGWSISRLFASILFQVDGSDVTVYAVVAAIVSFLCITASIAPARFASRIDPNRVLRQN